MGNCETCKWDERMNSTAVWDGIMCICRQGHYRRIEAPVQDCHAYSQATKTVKKEGWVALRRRPFGETWSHHIDPIASSAEEAIRFVGISKGTIPVHIEWEEEE